FTIMYAAETQYNLETLYREIAKIRTLLESYLKGKEIQSLPSDELPDPLVQLRDRFHLSPFEQKILLLCAGIELDPQLNALCGEIAENSQQNYPTFSLALTVFPEADWGILSSQSPLQYWQLIEIAPNINLTQAPLSLDRRILSYLLSTPDRDRRLTGWISPLPVHETYLPPSREAIVREAVTTWVNAPDYPILQLCGRDNPVRIEIAREICDRLGFTLYCLPASILPVAPDELHQLAHRWTREAILDNSVLLIEGDLPPQSDRQNALQLLLADLQTPLILSGQQRQHFPNSPTIAWEIPALPHAEKRDLWELHLGDKATELNGHLEPLIAQFNISDRAIVSACASMQSKEDLGKNLWNYCRQQARPQLEHLAQRIECNATWDDLILPEKEKSILRDLSVQVKRRAKVYEKWGFAHKNKRGLGIAALFAGASGTGKTMAAEVLAREFNLDLYRIDLSAVTSKYIGETEKNLAQIFDAAEAGGVVLLFDEADALFGKRTQVKDSRDRYANLEVSYLLQRMEAYQGLAILTTNLKDSLDQAFIRRLRFIINFPFPKANARREIWQRIFPEQAPTRELDFSKLGQLDVTGGNIRAIALNAAFIAADADEPIMMDHILRAAKAEYLKVGRSLTQMEIENW
ncbi:MAG: ATP-binding protein, partial [Cyanobacteria bacterium P01_E01_bin.42]